MRESITQPIRGLLKSARERFAPRWLLTYRMPSRPSRTLYLTFDDGPHPVHTPAILDLLRKHQAKASFFVVGTHAEQHPEILRRTLEEGHAVGNHTYSHKNFKHCGYGQIAQEIGGGRAAIENITGERVRFFRPPKGRLYGRGFRAAFFQRVRVVLWSVDSLDYKWTEPDRIVKRLTEMKLTSGDILLFHDDYSHTLEALPRVLELLASRGWQLQALPVPAPRPIPQRVFPPAL